MDLRSKMYKAWAIYKKGEWRIEFETEEGLFYLCEDNKYLEFSSQYKAEQYIRNDKDLELLRR